MQSRDQMFRICIPFKKVPKTKLTSNSLLAQSVERSAFKNSTKKSTEMSRVRAPDRELYLIFLDFLRHLDLLRHLEFWP
jgi:hypothetical protein